MQDGTRRRIEALDRRAVGELRAEYERLFGEPSRSRNRRHLIRRLAWRIQAEAEGGLSDRARVRAEELADEHGLRLSAPSTTGEPAEPQKPSRRRRLAPGTVLVRSYKGRTIEVTVTEDGFLHEGETYRSLSAVARAVTGSRWSGNVFFGLTKRKRRR